MRADRSGDDDCGAVDPPMSMLTNAEAAATGSWRSVIRALRSRSGGARETGSCTRASLFSCVVGGGRRGRPDRHAALRLDERGVAVLPDDDADRHHDHRHARDRRAVRPGDDVADRDAGREVDRRRGRARREPSRSGRRSSRSAWSPPARWASSSSTPPCADPAERNPAAQGMRKVLDAMVGESVVIAMAARRHGAEGRRRVEHRRQDRQVVAADPAAASGRPGS